MGISPWHTVELESQDGVCEFYIARPRHMKGFVSVGGATGFRGIAKNGSQELLTQLIETPQALTFQTSCRILAAPNVSW